MVAHISGKDIGRYVDGEVGRDEALRLDRHLSTCTYCRSRLEAEQRLTLDLRSHFALPLPAGAHAPASRAAAPTRWPAAAAAVLAILVAYPTVSRDLQPPPTTGASSVVPFNLGVRVDGGPAWSDLSSWSGYVVATGQGTLDMRVGADVLRVDLPSGTQAGTFPVGAAVTVRGSLVRQGIVSALAIQEIER